MADLLHIRTPDGRDCEVTQSQWDLIYQGDGSRIVTTSAGAGDGASDDDTGPVKTPTKRS